MRSINSELPPHILQVIFSKLPLPQFPFCRQVCKAWNSLVLDLSSSPNFLPLSNTFLVSSFLYDSQIDTRRFSLHAVQHTPQGITLSASFPLDLLITGSCNGLLLCVTNNKHHQIPSTPIILNPMTNEYFTPSGSGSFGNKRCHYGLGFSPDTNEYKLARITPLGGFFDKNCSLDILTIGKSTQWTHIASIPFAVDTEAVYFNGALYWCGINRGYKHPICCFDFHDNQFRELDVWETRMQIGSYNGGLHASTVKEDIFEVWIMREKDSWIREFVVDAPQFWPQLQLVRACQDEKILCLVQGFYFDLYNPNTGRMKRLNKDEQHEIATCSEGISTRINRRFRLHNYIESLKFDTLQTIFTANV